MIQRDCEKSGNMGVRLLYFFSFANKYWPDEFCSLHRGFCNDRSDLWALAQSARSMANSHASIIRRFDASGEREFELISRHRLKSFLGLA